ncbi:hypothetical protein RvY_09842 [Ramazzottius varieornatus]|uniref:Acyl-CoA dehydrogenase/oxidase N-terminal domain-containing protein n=1 Tax=Ramazzottius varieornatus TaxID=947166 RepID=A0A1D1VIJ4_RAMVA|nr:hypothetical protein RvY_09842 [Ramazzottius varieornatus]
MSNVSIVSSKMASRNGIHAVRQLLTPLFHNLKACSARMAHGISVESKTDGIFTDQHYEIRNLAKKLIDTEVNPFVDQWEADGQFPAHKVFKKFGDAGLLGLNRPSEYGGMDLDFSYNMAFAEELGSIDAGGVTSAFGVHTDMATPAFSK